MRTVAVMRLHEVKFDEHLFFQKKEKKQGFNDLFQTKNILIGNYNYGAIQTLSTCTYFNMMTT